MPNQCLNRKCPDSGKTTFKGYECPSCGGLKIQWVQSSGATSGNSQNIDTTLRGLADSFGLTDISNRDGKPAKGHAGQSAPEVKGTFGKMNVAGVEVPVEATATAAWGGSAYTPFAVPTKGRFSGRKPIPTVVTARHDGKR